MISNQILQNTIEGLKGISRVDFCVLDTEGKELAATFESGQDRSEAVLSFVESPADSQVIQGCQFFKIFDEQRLEYVLLADGDSEDVYMLGKIAAFQIQSLLVAYKERFDKDNFIKNLLLDNLLLVDIYNRAKKLHIDTEAKRVIFIIETSHEKDNAALENVRSLLGGRSKDFITAVDEKNIIVVKELTDKESGRELEKMAKEMLDTLHSEGEEERIRIAYGTIVNDIKEVSKSYKEAKLALDVGKIFFDEKDIIAFATLGIGRLIYQLPLPLCRMFIKEIFEGKSPDEFDEETLTTINKFFENSLNVSETSRQLYIHRNTLVYRLDKLQKSTGLDLRVFEDAITFKIALMVVKYMKYMESLEYYELRNVTKEYSKGNAALNGVSVKIERGEFVFIVGDSGSGKSTLIRLIMKELNPTEGTIIVNGQNLNRMKHRHIAKYRRGLGVVFQDFRLLKDRNIYENIAFALRVTETPTRVIKKKVPAALSLVGLAQKYKSFPKELSGGEQQRVAIARALVNEPAILLCDEPTGNLDPTNSWEIMSILKEANERGTTVLVVTHNQEIVNEMNERVITMKQGVIVSDEQKGGYIDED